MDASMHNPKMVRTMELEQSEAVVLIVSDESGNDIKLFFSNYDSFVNFGKAVTKGGSYGIKYDIPTGQAIKGGK